MLLQAQAVNATDIMFRITDVIFIVSGVITIVSAFFAFRNSNSKVNDRIDTEVLKGDEKRKAIMREFELHVEKNKALEARIMEVENSLDTLEGELSKKIDAMGKDIQTVNLSIEKMKSEILQHLLDKK